MNDAGKAVLGLVGLVIIVVWAFAVFAGGGKKPDAPSVSVVAASAPSAPAQPSTPATEPVAPLEANVQQQTGYEGFIIVKTKESVSARLRDPEGAVFSDVHVGNLQGAKVVCGYVNAKNALGGKTGRQRFIGLGDTTFLEEEGAQAVNDVWRQAC